MRLFVVAASVTALVAAATVAVADHENRPSNELTALGHSPNPASFLEDPEGPAPPEINSDLAFWGDLAFNGNYDGFRIIDVSDPMNPVEISHERCQGNQGDIVVWENTLIRSWNSPAPEGATCDGQPVTPGWEGLHVFDISDPSDPVLIGSVELACGSHTATAVPDRRNDRLIVYSHTSGGPCYSFDVVEVPFDDPASARLIWQQPLEGEHACHDSGVILGKVNLMACASGHMTNVFDIGRNARPGGSLTRPKFLYGIEEEGVGPVTEPGAEHSGSWHSAAFTWDGKVLVLGWEPGGGAQAECEATDPAVTKSAFFYNARTGKKLGQWTLPRPQTAEENCTIHNYNIVPIRDRYIMVSGNYQAGTWVTEFTNPRRPKVLAWSDPEPVVPTQLGGVWSSYWYNRLIYESNITEGLNIFRYDSPRTRRAARMLDHLNPQTQEFSF